MLTCPVILLQSVIFVIAEFRDLAFICKKCSFEVSFVGAVLNILHGNPFKTPKVGGRSVKSSGLVPKQAN